MNTADRAFLPQADPGGTETPSSCAPGASDQSSALRGVAWCQRKRPDMADKSPRKTMSKKPAKSLKEKRREKKDKEEVHRRIT